MGVLECRWKLVAKTVVMECCNFVSYSFGLVVSVHCCCVCLCLLESCECTECLINRVISLFLDTKGAKTPGLLVSVLGWPHLGSLHDHR